MAALLVSLPACGGNPRELPVEHARPKTARALATDPGVPTWTEETWSPQVDALDIAFASCGTGDAALGRVARVIAERASRSERTDPSDLSLLLKASGSPHVEPRLWQLSGPRAALADAGERLARHLPRVERGATRRCGVARVQANAEYESIAVVYVDALADLEPVPRRAHLGRWIQVSAPLLGTVGTPAFVLLGPGGEPRTLPTSGGPERVTAAFSVDREGPWLAQLIADTASGPSPLLEVLVFVGDAPPADPRAQPAPGEAEAALGRNDVEAMLFMTNAARQSEGRAPLHAHRGLDPVARAHAEAMRAQGKLGHDVGDGNPTSRLRQAGLDPRVTGENVAHALSLERAHRALWASPSHRGNLLDRRFQDLGVGVARDTDGSVWVCQLFGGFADAGMN